MDKPQEENSGWFILPPGYRAHSFQRWCCLPLLIVTILWSLPVFAMSICFEASEYPPYTLGHTALSNQRGGVLVDLIRDTATKLDLDLKLVPFPWKRCLYALEHNQIDSAFGMIWTPERSTMAVFPSATGSAQGIDPDGNPLPPAPEYRLWRVQYPFFVKRIGTVTWNGEKLTGYKNGFAAPIGYVAQQRLVERGWHYPGEIDIPVGLKMVSLDRLDGYVVETAIGLQQLKSLGLADIVAPLPIPFLEAELYLTFSKDFYQANTELAQTFWKTYARIRDTRGSEIMSSYLPGTHINP